MQELKGVELLIQIAQEGGDRGILVSILYEYKNGIHFADIRREMKQRRRKLSGVILKEEEFRKLVKDSVNRGLASQEGDQFNLLEDIRRLIKLQKEYSKTQAW